MKSKNKFVFILIAILFILAVLSFANSKKLITSNKSNKLGENEDIKILVEDITGYNKDDILQIINAVKRIEELDHKFSNFLLTYDEYISELDKLDIFFADWIDEESHYERRYVPIIDMKNLNEKEISEMKNEIGMSDEVKVEMSKVYKDDKNIYIFTKSTINNDDSDGMAIPDNIITRRYDIKEVDGILKIITINIGIYDENTEDYLIKYNKFNNEIVEYVYTFDPIN